MLGHRFQKFVFSANFLGVNTKDSNENMLEGEWHQDSINIDSDPQGSLGSRPGYTALTTASIGTANAWIGFYHYKVHAGGATTSHYIGGGSDGKIYEFESSQYTELYSGLNSTDPDHRISFLTLNNTALILTGQDQPLQYSGIGSATTLITGVTADFGIEWQRYAWIHSTVDKRLVYYGDQDAVDNFASFLNFDYDPDEVSGLSKQGDDMLVGKPTGLYRVQFRGTDPLFKIYKLQARVGPINHWVMKELPDGRVIFLARDFNFWMATGDSVVEVGDNIKSYMKAGIQSRLQFAVSGIDYENDRYWCSFTRLAGGTENDRTVVMDYSRPYQDKWGKIQYPWFIFSIGAACFAEVTLSGRSWLYHGGYTGKMYRNDSGTNDDGTAILSHYRSKAHTHGDPTLEKKWDSMEMRLDNSGDWDLGISFVADENANTQKTITQNLLVGVGSQSLFDVAKFDEDNFSQEGDAFLRREVMRMGKSLYITFGTSGLDESWRVHEYVLHAKALRRGARNREG